MKIDNKQKGHIHALISELGWAREEYVKWLQYRFEVSSFKFIELETADRIDRHRYSQVARMDCDGGRLHNPVRTNY